MTEPLDIEPGQPCAVRRFESRDADGVVRLFRSVRRWISGENIYVAGASTK